ncbi:transporter substrate-binding domain-containing protein [Dethiothermospora halolimnae]|uniref:transporter substrate-binding domain-containing protein n=1 Tax=Dethiothermospora halolimnae TaxID=3114390 RepID=UPI003CCC145E
MFKKGLLVFISLVMVISLFGCGSSEEDVSKLEKIKKDGKIVLGTSADYPPYEFHKEIDGKDKIVGFDIEIAKKIAEDLGVELEIKDMQFKGLLPALKTDKVDFVIAGMTPDKERAKEVDFSNIYYNAEHGLVILEKNKDKYKSVEDFKGKTIGVQKGAIQERIAKEQIADVKLKSLGKVTDLMLQLKKGRIDGVLVEDVVGSAYVRNNEGLLLTDIVLKDDDGGSAIAIKKGNKELVEKINKTIKALKEEKLIKEFAIKANEMLQE